MEAHEKVRKKHNFTGKVNCWMLSIDYSMMLVKVRPFLCLRNTKSKETFWCILFYCWEKPVPIHQMFCVQVEFSFLKLYIKVKEKKSNIYSTKCYRLKRKRNGSFFRLALQGFIGFISFKIDYKSFLLSQTRKPLASLLYDPMELWFFFFKKLLQLK